MKGSGENERGGDSLRKRESGKKRREKRDGIKERKTGRAIIIWKHMIEKTRGKREVRTGRGV